MKYKKILIILSIATLSLTACNKPETQPTEAPVIEEEITEPEEEPVVEESEIPEETEVVETDIPETTEVQEESSVIITEVLDTKMYVIKASDIKKLDNEKSGSIAPAEEGAYLTVTGKTSNGWYEVAWGNGKGYLPADTLSTENPFPDNGQDPLDAVGTNGMTLEEMMEIYNKAMGETNVDDVVGEGLGDDVEYFVAPDYSKIEIDW